MSKDNPTALVRVLRIIENDENTNQILHTNFKNEQKKERNSIVIATDDENEAEDFEEQQKKVEKENPLAKKFAKAFVAKAIMMKEKSELSLKDKCN